MQSLPSRLAVKPGCRLSWFAVWCFGFFLSSVVFALAQPANNDFTNATSIAGLSGSVSSDTFGASKEAGEPAHAGDAGGASVWFRWTAPANGTVNFSTAGSGFDTLLAVYTGTAVNALTPVVSDDDSGPGLTSSVTFSAVAGTVYRIAIDGFFGAAGLYDLRWSLAGSAGVFRFTSGVYEAGEAESFAPVSTSVDPSFRGARITVTRDNGAVGSAVVTYRITDGTAVSPTLYQVPASAVPIATTNATAAISGVSGIFTNFPPAAVNVASNFITLPNHGFANNAAVRLASTGALPTGLTTTNTFFVIVLDQDTIRLSLASGPGAAVVISTVGTGTHIINSGIITGAMVLQSGFGYFGAAPIVTVIDPTGTGANLRANVSGGAITGITVLSGGVGYSGNPQVVISPAPNNYLDTLTFRDYQMSKSFFVTPSPSASTNLTNTVFFGLVNASLAPNESTAILPPSLGTQSNSLLSIADRQMGVNFERIRFRCNEYVGTASIRVLRGAGVPDDTTTDYRINGPGGGSAAGAPNNSGFRLDPGSDYATPGNDFTNVSGRISWSAGVNFFDIDIPIVDDSAVEFNEDFRVDLFPVASANPAPLGPSTNAYVTIVYDDRATAEAPAGSVDARWNRDYFSGTTPPFNATPGANDTVHAVALQADGKALLGGDFTAVNSVGRNRIARMNTDGSLDTTFTPGTGANGAINAIVVQPNQQILIGGVFSSYNSVLRGGVARLNPSGALDGSFSPGNGANDAVRALAVYTNGVHVGKIIVAGDFTTFAGLTLNRLVRLNANGSVDTTFSSGAGANAPINSVIIQPSGKVVIGGDFTSVNGTLRNHIARLNVDGSLDENFNPGVGADGAVNALASVVSGNFLTISRSASGGPAEDRFTVDTGSTSGTIVINYDFLNVPDTMHVYYQGVLIYDSGLTNGTNLVTIPYGPGTSTSVEIVMNEGSGLFGTIWFYDVTVFPAGGVQKVVMAGAFSSVDLHSRNRIARLKPDGSLDPDFDPGFGADDTIFALEPQPDGRLLIGGLFTSFNATRRVGVARLLDTGSLDTSFMDTAYNQFAGLITTNSVFVEPKNFVRSMALQTDGNIILGGSFKHVGGGGHNTTASGPSSPWGGNVSTPSWIARDDIRNRYNVARLIGGTTAGPGNIGFTQDAYTIDEYAGTAYITLARTNGSLAAAFVQFNTGDRPAGPGSASSTSDYVAVAGTPTWTSTHGTASNTRMVSDSRTGPNNNLTSRAADVIIPIADDTLTEGDEALNLLLDLPASNLALGGEVIPVGVALGKASATLTIVDDDPEPTFIGFATNSFAVDEGAGTATVTVTRTGATDQSVTVTYFTTDGSATDTQDYHAVFGTLTFAPGQTAKTFSVPIIDDTTAEADETINLSLTNLSAGASFRPGESLATLTIFDNDFASGQLRFSAASYTVNENAGAITITVNRTGGNVGAIAVDFATSNLSAVATADYVATNGTLIWANGDTTPRSFTVPILTDGLVEGPEAFTVVLSNARVIASGTAVPIAGANPVTVNLTDADSFGSLQFAASNFTVSENGGTAIITVNRIGGSSGTVSVKYGTTPGTASSPTDFLNASGTLILGPGVTSANFPVTINDNPVQNASILGSFNRTVVLDLSNFTNAAPGVPITAVLTIVDDEQVNEPAGSVDTTYNASAGANGFVYSLALQPDGQLLIGGDFTAFNGFTRNRLARLDGNGSLDNVFDPGAGASDSVRSVALQTDGRILIGGLFTNYDGASRNYIARLDVDGSLDQTFDPGAGTDNPVYAVALHSDSINAGRVIIGGAFAAINGVSRPYVARLLANGMVDSSFDTGDGPNGTVFAAAIQNDGKVLIGGDFTTVNGLSSPGLARLNANGSLDTNFTANLGAGASGSVRALAIQSDGKIMIGGLFTNFNGTVINHLARLNANGTLDSGFLPNTNPAAGGDGSVLAIAIQPDGKLIVGGDFTEFSGVTRSRLTRLNQDGSVDPTINFGAGANDFIAATTAQVADGRILVAGGFTVFNGLPRNYLARLYGGVIAGPGRLEFSSPTYTVNENVTNATITVRRTGGTAGPVSVDYATSNGTATGGSGPGPGIDFLTDTNTLNFANGETIRMFNVPIIDDTVVEGNETVKLALTNLTGGATFGNQPVATLTIVDDDSFVAFSSATYSVNENVASGVAAINVVRTGGTNGTFTVQVATSNLTALAGVRYAAVTNTLTFAPGEASKTVNIPIINNNVAEGDQTVALRLVNHSGAVTLGSPSLAVLTILEDDFFPGTFVFSSPAGYVVDENATNAVITVIRTNGSSGNVTVNFATSDGTANATGTNIDYASTNGTLVFADGEIAKSFLVRVFSDLLIETNETVVLTLSNPTGNAAIGAPNPVTLTINNNNEFIFGSFRFSATNYTATEGDGFRLITVERVGGSVGTNSVDFTTSDGTATVGADYLGTNGVLVFLPGETVKTFQVPVLTDNLVETNETVNLMLFNPVGGASLASPAVATLTIISTNQLPGSFAFETTNFTAPENAGLATITVLRTNGFTGTVSVDVRISDGSARGTTNGSNVGFDYTNTTPVRTLTWTNGDTAPQTFTIGLIDDLLVEADETVLLKMENPLGTAGTPAISTTNATLTILDDEIPAGSLDTGFAGDANGTVYSLALRASNAKLSVGGDFNVVNGVGRTNVARLNADGTVDGFDVGSLLRGGTTNTSVRAVAVYTDGPHAGKVIIAGLFDSVAGSGRTNIARFNADGTVDASFNPGAGANAVVNAVAIQNDGAVVLGGAFTSVGGMGRNFVARLTVDGALDPTFDPGAGASDIVRAVVIQTDGKVVIGGDFTIVNSMPSGRIARLNADGSVDGTFGAKLGTGADAPVLALGLHGDGVIVVGGAFTNFNGVTSSRLAHLNSSGVLDTVAFGGFGSGFNDSVFAVAVQADDKEIIGGAFTQLQGVMQNRLARLNTNGTLDLSINFGTGANNFVDTIAIQPDGKIVIGGGFTRINGIPANHLARLNGGENLGSGVLEFSSSSYTVTESGINALISVNRLGGTSNTVSVTFATSAGTAQPGSDYLEVMTNLVFAPGETVKTVLVPILNDTVVDPDETVHLTLSAPTGGASLSGQSAATLTILDDDGVLQFSSPAFSVNENSGTATIHVVRTGGTAGTVSVAFNTTNGTAVAGADYVATSGTLTFAPGETNKTFTVTILNDALIEGSETIGLLLHDPAGAAGLGLTNAVLTIVDDDIAAGVFTFSDAAYSVDENAGTVTITIIRTNGTAGTASVRVSSTGGTATPNLDFVPLDTVVSFADGETVKTVRVQVIDDAIAEPTETVTLALSNATGGAGFGAITQATLTILDEDSSFEFSAPNYTTIESSGLTVITVNRVGTTNNAASVRVRTVTTTNSTATAGSDYLPVDTLLTFDPGITNQSFTVIIVDDALIEGIETFGLELLNPSGATLGLQSTSQVSIVDDDNVIAFTSGTFSVNEFEPTATITLARTGNVGSTSTVTCVVSSGTATDNLDFIGGTNVVTFQPGETNQSFQVPILNDTLVEGNETVLLRLVSAGGGATLGLLTNATLTILDDDIAGTLAFSSATYSVNEASNVAVITVIRTNGNAGSVSVNFSVANGTATAGQDYTDSSGAVTFADGETNKTFNVPILNDAQVEGDETVILTLSNPAGGASLGSITNAVLTIVDDDFHGALQFSTNDFVVTEGVPAAVISVARVGGMAGAVVGSPGTELEFAL